MWIIPIEYNKMKPEDVAIMRIRLLGHGIAQPGLDELPSTTSNLADVAIQEVASKPENKFFALWIAYGGPKIEREYKWSQARRWRADFAHIKSKTLIEIDGAVWGTKTSLRGGHSGHGKIRDCEKDLDAHCLGWRTIRLVPSQITVETIKRLIACLR